MKSEIRHDLFFWDEDGNRIDFVGAVAEKPISDGEIARYVVTVGRPDLLEHPEYEAAMLSLAEAGVERLAEEIETR